MERRLFFLGALAFFLPGAWLKNSANIKIIFSADLRQMGLSIQEFTALRSRFEDDAAIDKMNSIFEKRGLLLDRSFEESSDGLKWVYTFKDITSFNVWEQNLYDLGMVNKENRPYKIDREYCLVV
jgi:hypothetical protein